MMRWWILLAAAVGAGAWAGARIAAGWGVEVAEVERVLVGPVGWQR